MIDHTKPGTVTCVGRPNPKASQDVMDFIADCMENARRQELVAERVDLVEKIGKVARIPAGTRLTVQAADRAGDRS